MSKPHIFPRGHKNMLQPGTEPITLNEAKTYLRVDSSDDDGMIPDIIKAARFQIEELTGRAMIHQNWLATYDSFPDYAALELPRVPVSSIVSFNIYDETDTPTAVSAAIYYLDTASTPGRVVLREGQSWPTPTRRGNGVEIVYTAGYGAGASNVPQDLRQAVLLLTAHWYENRGDTSVPAAVLNLIQPYKVHRL